MSQNISARAASAREQARSSDGKFGVQPHDRADDIDLGDDLPGPKAIDVEPNHYGGLPVRSEVWYDEAEDSTVLSTDIDIRADEIIALPDPADEGRSEGREDAALRAAAYDLVQRHVDQVADFDDSDPWASRPTFTVTTESAGRVAAADMVAQEDREGRVARIAELASTDNGGGVLSRDFFARAQATAVVEDISAEYTYGISAADEEAMQPAVEVWRDGGCQEAPVPTDAQARAFAFHVTAQCPEAEDLCYRGYADREKLATQLAEMRKDRSDHFMSQSLEAWLGQARSLEDRLQDLRERY